MQKMIIGVLFILVFNFSIGQTIAVEQVAEFPGGLSKFYDYLNKNIKYPKDAKKKGISGKVYIEFFVKENGEVDKDSLRAVPKEEIIKSIGAARASDIVMDESLELEAMRVIRNCPKWIPGSRRDVPVRQKIVLPIAFTK
jgi:periplasmic protein TonB